MTVKTQKCESNRKILTLFSIMMTVLSITLPVLESSCSSQEFECNDGSCIPKSWECDYEKDCNGGEDEGEQCADCEKAGYICRETGKCIPNQWKCDNWTDCLLQDDERFCGECKSNEFKCNDGECISLDKLCDYNNDCYGGEDENLILSNVEQTQLNPPKNAVANQCDSCESKLGNGTIMCSGKCILGKLCDGIPDCFDNSDECRCGGDNPYYNHCLGNNTNNNNNNNIKTTAFQQIYEDDDDAPRWKYCPDITWLAFITYPDNDMRYEENPKLKALVQPNITKVYWIEPKLRTFICSNGQPCKDYQVISDKKPGANFSLGKHQVRYVGKKISDKDSEDEAVACVIDILVLGGMKRKQIKECTDSDNNNLVNYDFTIDQNYFVILNSGKLDGKNIDIGTARYYLPDQPHLNCYGSIVFEESIPIDDNILYTAIDWMLQHVWPIIGLVIGVILLICGLCCGILCLWRKQAEYKAYEAANDFENSDDDDTDNDDDIGITSGQPIGHHQKMSLSQSQMQQMQQIQQQHQHRLSLSQNQPSIIYHPNSNNTTPNSQILMQQHSPYYHTNPLLIQQSSIDNNTNNINANIINENKPQSIQKRRRSILGMPVDINVNKSDDIDKQNNNNNNDNDKNNNDDDDDDDNPINNDIEKQQSIKNNDDDAQFLDNEWDNEQHKL